MPRGVKGRVCKDCGVRETDGATVSKRGLCPDCAYGRWKASIQEVADDPEGHARRCSEGIARSRVG